MCVRVINKDTGKEAVSTMAFAAMFDVCVSALQLDQAYKTPAYDSCLCQIDIPKTCDMFGYHCIENRDFDWEISKRTAFSTLQEIVKHK